MKAKDLENSLQKVDLNESEVDVDQNKENVAPILSSRSPQTIVDHSSETQDGDESTLITSRLFNLSTTQNDSLASIRDGSDDLKVDDVGESQPLIEFSMWQESVLESTSSSQPLKPSVTFDQASSVNSVLDISLFSVSTIQGQCASELVQDENKDDFVVVSSRSSEEFVLSQSSNTELREQAAILVELDRSRQTEPKKLSQSFVSNDSQQQQELSFSHEQTFTAEDRQDLLQTKLDYEEQIVTLTESVDQLQAQLAQLQQAFDEAQSSRKIEQSESESKLAQNHDQLLELEKRFKSLQIELSFVENEAQEKQAMYEQSTIDANIYKSKYEQQLDAHGELVEQLESTIGRLRQELSNLKCKYELTLVPEHASLKVSPLFLFFNFTVKFCYFLVGTLRAIV